RDLVGLVHYLLDFSAFSAEEEREKQRSLHIEISRFVVEGTCQTVLKYLRMLEEGEILSSSSSSSSTSSTLQLSNSSGISITDGDSSDSSSLNHATNNS